MDVLKAANYPKADICCGQISRQTKTARAAGISGRMPPTATSDDAVFALVRTVGIVLQWFCSPVTWIIEIPAPLGHVASHVIKTEFIGLITANYSGIGFAAH